MLPMTKAERIQLWLDRLRRQAASQLTVVEFCRLDAISVPSFYQWKRRLSPRVDSDPHVESSPKRRPVKRAASPRFTELVVPSATTLTHAAASVHPSVSADSGSGIAGWDHDYFGNTT